MRSSWNCGGCRGFVLQAAALEDLKQIWKPSVRAAEPGAAQFEHCARGCAAEAEKMRYDQAILGPGYFTRDDYPDYYGHINGIARWDRAARLRRWRGRLERRPLDEGLKDK